MDPAAPPVSRKLADAVFRRFWLRLIPVVAVPALVLQFVHHDTVYESVGSAWVTAIDSSSGATFTSGGSTAAWKPAAERQVEILTDLVATRAFREEVAIGAGLISATALPAERVKAADALLGRIGIVMAGPNLVAVKASASSPEEAQAISMAVISHYQLRAHTESTREAATVLAYFDAQVASAQTALAEASAAAQAYLVAHPAVKTTPDAEYQRLLSAAQLQESVLSRLLQGQEDAQLSAATIVASAESVFVVQDLPELPEAPLGVPLATRAAYPAAGLVLGLVIALAWTWLSYRTDRTIRSSEDLRELDIAVLGTVPELSPRDIARRFTPLRWTGFLRRNYARRVAASISPIVQRGRVAS
jgi:hypothetical protein